MSAYKTFVISLKDNNNKRREWINKECKLHNLNPNFIDATDFRSSSKHEASSYYVPTKRSKRKNKFLTPAEIGCSLSHRKVYKKIVKNSIKLALVLEDDVQFLCSPKPILNDIAYQNIDFDVLILGYVKVRCEDLPYHYRKVPIKNLFFIQNFFIGPPIDQYPAGAVAYLITLEGAKKMLTEDKVRAQADDWLFYKNTYNVKTFHIRPNIAIEKYSLGSGIREESSKPFGVKKSSFLIRSVKGYWYDFWLNVLNFNPKKTSN